MLCQSNERGSSLKTIVTILFLNFIMKSIIQFHTAMEVGYFSARSVFKRKIEVILQKCKISGIALY